MLQKLLIQNYAIIESVEIEFSNNLNIITGETGAGKSILIGALGLILGERADSSVLYNDTQKCIVEGSFFISDREDVKAFLEENDLESEEQTIIRREVSATGKSRAFINDIPVPLSRLKQFTALLVDLHQQFDTLELGDNDFQLAVIDALAGHKNTLAQYQSAYTQYHATQRALNAAKEQQLAANRELDYYQFQYNELEEANWKENELEALDSELKLLANAENIKSVLLKIIDELSEGDQPFVQQLKGLGNQLQSINDFHTAIPTLAARLQSAQIELRDIADEIEHLNSGIRFDEERIQVVNDRLALGHKLLKKHGVRTTTELLQIQNNLEQELDKVLNLDAEIARLEKKVNTELQAATALAQTLTNNRQKQLAPFEKETNKLLVQVGMPNARIKVSLSEAPLDVTGSDSIEFLFDANKSNRFESLKKVASGGELSRLMLCIKSLVAISVQLPTLIFDEIDTGISGEAARQVGIIMKTLGQSHQVIAITHQPQIAAKADAHFFVYKKEKEQKINTRIKLLSAEERVLTIAQMLSGEKPTATALDNAKEMMERI